MTNGNTVCECGARYAAFRATNDAGRTLTFAEVHAMMRVGSEDSSLWVCRSRGAVLRFWSFLKRAQWETMHGYCAQTATADEMPEWVTDSTSVDVGYTGDDESTTTTTAIAVEVTYTTNEKGIETMSKVTYNQSMTTPATEEQMTQLRRRAVNDATREIMRDGVFLTQEQADDLGEETLGWIGGRLGLNVKATDRGVECTPPVRATTSGPLGE